MQPNLENCGYMKKILVILSAILVSTGVWAVMATPELIVKTQSDDSTVTLKMVGDEFHNYYTRPDGTPVRLNKDGMWVNDAQVSIAPEAARKARRVAQQTQKQSSYPLKGSPKSLVILVNFSDLSFQFKLEDFQLMLNESGYNKNGGVGSARDYFIASSDSTFAPVFDCYGPVTVSKGFAYYGANSGSSSSLHASQMVVEACNLVADQGIDLTQYDTDNDGRLDNVFIYYAGHNEAEGASASTIWPHRSVVSGSERVQGKLIYDYACTSELRGISGKSMCGIGTFCHEFGHVLGLPDYYDTDYNYYTVGTWDIMCSGSYNGSGKTPPAYTAGERFQLGWLTPVQLSDAGYYELPALETSNTAYLIAKTTHNLSWESASPNEYWLLENRQHVGWDAPTNALPGTGMLIWHINYNAAAWGSNTPNNNLPLRYDVEEAGGAKGYSAASDPFPGTFKITQFTPVLHSGEIVEQPLYGIAETNGVISFTFKSSDFMVLPTDLPVIQSTYNPDTKKSRVAGSRIKVIGEKLDPEADVIISISGKSFQLSADSANWTTSILARPTADSLLEQDVFVRYKPGKQVCDIEKGTVTVRQGTKVGSYIVRGTSPRPTLIGTPSISKIEDVTPTTFKVHWEPEEDAEEYYITLYHMEDGEETTMESFEGFDDEITVQESGWYTSFYRTTTKAKEDGAVSIWFKDNNEVLMSPIYPLPVTQLSFWLNAPATTDTEVGIIKLIAMSEEGNDTIENIEIGKNTKKYTYKAEFDESKDYHRFRLEYTSLGGEGTCLDAFCTTFNQKTVYSFKGREKTILAQDGDIAEDHAVFYAYDLLPDTYYYIRLQCSENKGCEEHLSTLSEPLVIATKKGEAADSEHLTLDVDSISYDPARHVVYLPQALTSGSICLYTSNGELIKRIPVGATVNVVPLPEDQMRRGAVYFIKYLPENKMNRKSPWIKIVF